MNFKKAIYLYIVSILLITCRAEDMFLSSLDEGDKSKFVVFTKRAGGKEVDYVDGFKVLAFRYDSLYQKNYAGRKSYEIIGKGGKTNEPYFEFRVRTELVTEDNGDKWFVFPRVQGTQVVDLIYAGLLQDETYVTYKIIDKDSDFYKEYVDDYQKKIFALQNKNLIQKIGTEDDPVHIDDVYIIPPKKNWGSISVGYFNGMDDIGGGECNKYMHCIYNNPGGGGSYTPTNPPKNNQDPCKKVSDKLNNPKVTPKINELKNNAKLNGEKGFKIKANGEPSAMIDGGEGSHAVNMGDMSGYEGFYHNHTATGINMFSPQDIINMLDFAIYQGVGNYGNAYSGMIGADHCPSCPGNYKYHHYIMQYTGSDADLNLLVNYTGWDNEEVSSYYYKIYVKLVNNPSYFDNSTKSLNSVGLEKLFFGILDNMGLKDKVSLKRVNGNNEVENITVDSNNNIKVKPCN